jgi:ATP-dependent Clp endopeptidase proteolytic subunit ClpP
MIERIKKALAPFITNLDEDEKKNLIFFDPAQLREPEQEASPMVGLFAEVIEEKIGELVHALLYANDINKHKAPEDIEPIDFYISTYGGSGDDMFALYDVMRTVRERTPIHTVGLGKVMSAGVLILAAGTEGERKIGKNCRVMIHSVVGGNQGDLHNMLNEMEAIEQQQQMFIDCLVSETKLTKSRLKKMLERKVNVYLSAEEAVELGIADIII